MMVAQMKVQGMTEIGEHTSELQSHHDLVCRLLLEKKKKQKNKHKNNKKKKKKKHTDIRTLHIRLE